MKTKLLQLMMIFLLFPVLILNAQVPSRTGWWRFDDTANKLKADIGAILELTGTMDFVSGPVTGNSAVLIGVGSYLTMYHGIAANGGGERVNEYSLQIDFSVPEGEMWHSFFQITSSNTDDGDLFTNLSNQIGVWEAGYSDTVFTVDTWYRMLLTVRNGEFFRIYIDGEQWLDAEGREIDARYSLSDTLLIFADNDEEDNDILCSELGIWDVALTPEQVKELGNANVSPGTGILKNSGYSEYSSLGKNFPNPFSATTTFPYQIEKAGIVSFRILDIAGKEIRLINEGVKTPGNYKLDITSEQLNSGIYYFQMNTDNGSITRKMVVFK